MKSNEIYCINIFFIGLFSGIGCEKTTYGLNFKKNLEVLTQVHIKILIRIHFQCFFLIYLSFFSPGQLAAARNNGEPKLRGIFNRFFVCMIIFMGHVVMILDYLVSK